MAPSSLQRLSGATGTLKVVDVRAELTHLVEWNPETGPV